MNKQHNSRSNKSQNSISIRGKLGLFRQSLRQNYIESTINAMREQLLVAQNKDYHLLKKINLQQCFNIINNIQDIGNEFNKLDQAILNMFAYCVTLNSSHMYCIMSDFTLQKLIKMVQWKNISLYEIKPRVYVRIQRIISNYCNYACGAPQIYFDVIVQIMKNILQQSNFYSQSLNCLFFTHAQVKQLISVIFQGLGQINFEKIESLGFFIDKSQNLITLLLNEVTKVFHSMQKNNYDQNNKEITILNACFKIFQNFLALDIAHPLDYASDSLQIQKFKIIESLDIEIINRLLEILKYVKNHYKEHQYFIARCLISYLRKNLQQKPQILLKHDFRIMLDCFKESVSNVKQIHSQIFNFDKRLQIEGEKNISLIHLGKIRSNYEKLLSQWLGILVIVFGVNLPDEISDKQQTNNIQKLKETQRTNLEWAYYEIWTDWLQNYIIPEFKQILKMNLSRNRDILGKVMNILQNICLDQTLCEILLEQPAISNFIFYNCKSAQVKIDIKRESIMCLVNMLRASYGDNLKKIMLNQAKKHDFPTIFADNIGVYSSPEINERILQGFSRLLQLDTCQAKNENYFWRLFCEAGGKRQLEKILDFKDQNWQYIVKFAENILYQYDIDEV